MLKLREVALLHVKQVQQVILAVRMAGVVGSKVASVGAWKRVAEVVLTPRVFVQITAAGRDKAVVDLGIVSSFQQMIFVRRYFCGEVGDQHDVTLSMLGVPWACAFGISAAGPVVPRRGIGGRGVAVQSQPCGGWSRLCS